jgi:signal transduction histidine kinase
VEPRVLDQPTQPVQLEADVVRLAQVFSNLLINAAKYTDPGGQIQLRAHQELSSVVVSVIDNGMASPRSCCRACSPCSSSYTGGSGAPKADWV